MLTVADRGRKGVKFAKILLTSCERSLTSTSSTLYSQISLVVHVIY